MNYLDIILHGYYKRPKYLSQHFVRECIKAEKDYCPAEMFFSSCCLVLERWESDLQKQVIAGKAPFYDKLALARTGKVVFDETQWKDTPPENRLNEVIESCKQELKAISAHDYRVDLPQWAIDRYNHSQLTYSEILQIKKALKKAVKSYTLDVLNNGLQELKGKLSKNKPELRIEQIALKYAYEGLRITRENSNTIVKQYGHNSGDKLYNRFTFFSSAANRKGKPLSCTPKKLENKIKLIESVIELLPSDKQGRAKDEVLY